MRRLLALLLLMPPAPGLLAGVKVPKPVAAAAENPQQESALKSTATVKVLGLDIRVADLVSTRKGDTLHLLWDALPYRDALAGKRAAGFAPWAEALAAELGSKNHPQARLYKITVVEFTERDSYGVPRYGSARILGRFEVPRDPATGQRLPAVDLNQKTGSP